MLGQLRTTETSRASVGVVDMGADGSMAALEDIRETREGGARERAAANVLDVLARQRAQLAGAMLIGVLLPAMMRWRLEWLSALPAARQIAEGDFGIGNAVAGSAIAMVLGFVAMRQMKAHPGARAFGYTLYPFVLTYGGLGMVLLFFRADYSRFQILASFALTVAWFLWVDRVTARRTIWRLGYLPGISAQSLPRSAQVNWLALDEATADSRRIQAADVTGVVADLSAEHSEAWERFLARCALDGLPVYDLRLVGEWLTGQVRVEHLSENTLSSTLSRLVYVRVKRLVDLAVVVAAAPVFALVIAAAAAAVKLESPGPALFTQKRVGHRGRPFVICKLRSMRVDGPAGEHFTADLDPRITAVGAFIRKYRIDEFPQIWNILKGEMSWIGPRPEAVALADWYDEEVPFYAYRHMVRPGITGWAQVNQGYAAKPDAAAEKLRYDFYYIKNLSPWLDLLILAKTARTILTGFGAR